jgi:hypothetical protein
MGLWNRVQAEYGIGDAGGVELLVQAAAMLDLVETLDAAIERDGGPIIQTRAGPKSHPAVRDLLAARSFIVRTLVKLGITVENVQPPGRPAQPLGWIPPER